MKTLEQIKNDYSVDLGYADWEDLMTEVCYFSNEEFFEHENEVMKIYAMECLKLAMYNSSIHGHDDEITNKNNIIK